MKKIIFLFSLLSIFSSCKQTQLTSKLNRGYKKIYANLSNKDLKDIQSIDLRIKNQATLKYIK